MARKTSDAASTPSTSGGAAFRDALRGLTRRSSRTPSIEPGSRYAGLIADAIEMRRKGETTASIRQLHALLKTAHGFPFCYSVLRNYIIDTLGFAWSDAPRAVVVAKSSPRRSR